MTFHKSSLHTLFCLRRVLNLTIHDLLGEHSAQGSIQNNKKSTQIKANGREREAWSRKCDVRFIKSTPLSSTWVQDTERMACVYFILFVYEKKYLEGIERFSQPTRSCCAFDLCFSIHQEWNISFCLCLSHTKHSHI